MTTSTTKDHPSETKADAATEPSTARKTQPELAVPGATSAPDLESRIKLYRARLIGALSELRAQSGPEAIQGGDRVKARLSELSHIVKEGVVDGWANVGDTVKRKLERWLAESERSLATQDASTKSGQA